jgi:Cdc6-like AAA superfamily ATPase
MKIDLPEEPKRCHYDSVGINGRCFLNVKQLFVFANPKLSGDQSQLQLCNGECFFVAEKAFSNLNEQHVPLKVDTSELNILSDTGEPLRPSSIDIHEPERAMCNFGEVLEGCKFDSLKQLYMYTNPKRIPKPLLDGEVYWVANSSMEQAEQGVSKVARSALEELSSGSGAKTSGNKRPLIINENANQDSTLKMYSRASLRATPSNPVVGTERLSAAAGSSAAKTPCVDVADGESGFVKERPRLSVDAQRGALKSCFKNSRHGMGDRTPKSEAQRLQESAAAMDSNAMGKLEERLTPGTVRELKKVWNSWLKKLFDSKYVKQSGSAKLQKKVYMVPGYYENAAYVKAYGNTQPGSHYEGMGDENIHYFVDEPNFLDHIHDNEVLEDDCEMTMKRVKKAGWREGSTLSKKQKDAGFTFRAPSSKSKGQGQDVVLEGINVFRSDLCVHRYVYRFPYPLQEKDKLRSTLLARGWCDASDDSIKSSDGVIFSLNDLKEFILWNKPWLLMGKAHMSDADISAFCLRHRVCSVEEQDVSPINDVYIWKTASSPTSLSIEEKSSRVFFEIAHTKALECESFELTNASFSPKAWWSCLLCYQHKSSPSSNKKPGKDFFFEAEDALQFVSLGKGKPHRDREAIELNRETNWSKLSPDDGLRALGSLTRYPYRRIKDTLEKKFGWLLEGKDLLIAPWGVAAYIFRNPEKATKATWLSEEDIRAAADAPYENGVHYFRSEATVRQHLRLHGSADLDCGVRLGATSGQSTFPTKSCTPHAEHKAKRPVNKTTTGVFGAKGKGNGSSSSSVGGGSSCSSSSSSSKDRRIAGTKNSEEKTFRGQFQTPSSQLIRTSLDHDIAFKDKIPCELGDPHEPIEELRETPEKAVQQLLQRCDDMNFLFANIWNQLSRDGEGGNWRSFHTSVKIEMQLGCGTVWVPPWGAEAFEHANRTGDVSRLQSGRNYFVSTEAVLEYVEMYGCKEATDQPSHVEASPDRRGHGLRRRKQVDGAVIGGATVAVGKAPQKEKMAPRQMQAETAEELPLSPPTDSKQGLRIPALPEPALVYLLHNWDDMTGRFSMNGTVYQHLLALGWSEVYLDISGEKEVPDASGPVVLPPWGKKYRDGKVPYTSLFRGFDYFISKEDAVAFVKETGIWSQPNWDESQQLRNRAEEKSRRVTKAAPGPRLRELPLHLIADHGKKVGDDDVSLNAKKKGNSRRGKENFIHRQAVNTDATLKLSPDQGQFWERTELHPGSPQFEYDPELHGTGLALAAPSAPFTEPLLPLDTMATEHEGPQPKSASGSVVAQETPAAPHNFVPVSFSASPDKALEELRAAFHHINYQEEWGRRFAVEAWKALTDLPEGERWEEKFPTSKWNEQSIFLPWWSLERWRNGGSQGPGMMGTEGLHYFRDKDGVFSYFCRHGNECVEEGMLSPQQRKRRRPADTQLPREEKLAKKATIQTNKANVKGPKNQKVSVQVHTADSSDRLAQSSFLHSPSISRHDAESILSPQSPSTELEQLRTCMALGDEEVHPKDMWHILRGMGWSQKSTSSSRWSDPHVYVAPWGVDAFEHGGKSEPDLMILGRNCFIGLDSVCAYVVKYGAEPENSPPTPPPEKRRRSSAPAPTALAPSAAARMVEQKKTPAVAPKSKLPKAEVARKAVKSSLVKEPSASRAKVTAASVISVKKKARVPETQETSSESGGGDSDGAENGDNSDLQEVLPLSRGADEALWQIVFCPEKYGLYTERARTQQVWDVCRNQKGWSYRKNQTLNPDTGYIYLNPEGLAQFNQGTEARKKMQQGEDYFLDTTEVYYYTKRYVESVGIEQWPSPASTPSSSPSKTQVAPHARPVSKPTAKDSKKAKHAQSHATPSDPPVSKPLKFGQLIERVLGNPVGGAVPSVREGHPLMSLNFVPDNLTGRNADSDFILRRLKHYLVGRTGGSLYICGTPGLGKTMTVTSVLETLTATQLKSGEVLPPEAESAARKGLRSPLPMDRGVSSSSVLRPSRAAKTSLPIAEAQWQGVVGGTDGYTTESDDEAGFDWEMCWVPEFRLVTIQGTEITQPFRYICEALDLSVKAATPAEFRSSAKAYFTSGCKSANRGRSSSISDSSGGSSGTKKQTSSDNSPMTILLIDEIDRAPKAAVRDLFEFACKDNSRLVVLGIANSSNFPTKLNLPDFAVPDVHVFEAYDAATLTEIFKWRTGGLFKPEALQFFAKKIFKEGSDVRKGLGILQRTIQTEVDKLDPARLQDDASEYEHWLSMNVMAKWLKDAGYMGMDYIKRIADLPPLARTLLVAQIIHNPHRIPASLEQLVSTFNTYAAEVHLHAETTSDIKTLADVLVGCNILTPNDEKERWGGRRVKQSFVPVLTLRDLLRIPPGPGLETMHREQLQKAKVEAEKREADKRHGKMHGFNE